MSLNGAARNRAARAIAIIGGRTIHAPTRPGWIVWLLAAWCVAEAGQHLMGAMVYWELGAAAGSRGRFRELLWRTPLAISYFALAAGLLRERSFARTALRVVATASAALGVASYFAPQSAERLLDTARLAQSPRYLVIMMAGLAWRARFAGERPSRFDGRLTGRDWLRTRRGDGWADVRLQFTRRRDMRFVRRAVLLATPQRRLALARFRDETAIAPGQWTAIRRTDEGIELATEGVAADATILVRPEDGGSAAVFELAGEAGPNGWLIEFSRSEADGPQSGAGKERV